MQIFDGPLMLPDIDNDQRIGSRGNMTWTRREGEKLSWTTLEVNAQDPMWLCGGGLSGFSPFTFSADISQKQTTMHKSCYQITYTYTMRYAYHLWSRSGGFAFYQSFREWHLWRFPGRVWTSRHCLPRSRHQQCPASIPHCSNLSVKMSSYWQECASSYLYTYM